MASKFECGKCGFKGKTERSAILSGEVCPNCKTLVFPDYLKEIFDASR
jgi:predicted Zn-ribbon and HTH transcriptional regulator